MQKGVGGVMVDLNRASPEDLADKARGTIEECRNNWATMSTEQHVVIGEMIVYLCRTALPPLCDIAGMASAAIAALDLKL